MVTKIERFGSGRDAIITLCNIIKELGKITLDMFDFNARYHVLLVIEKEGGNNDCTERKKEAKV